MYICTPEDGYHLSATAIKQVEEHYGAKYLGYWAIQNKDGNWTDQPVDVFYQSMPDVEKGHKHYFGMYWRDHNLMITDATSAFERPITGLLCDDDEVIVSRYRHDCVAKNGRMIDGGRDYLRSSVSDDNKYVYITVKSGEFQFERIQNEQGL